MIECTVTVIRAETVSKFRAVSGTAWRTPSPSPPKSAKVKTEVGYLIPNKRRMPSANPPCGLHQRFNTRGGYDYRVVGQQTAPRILEVFPPHRGHCRPALVDRTAQLASVEVAVYPFP
jgi:hypothetical protein